MKKIDTHVHTSEVSPCGKMTAAEMVEAYKSAGYDAIVITDHLILKNIIGQGLSPTEIVERQVRGYLAAVSAANGGIDVLLGAEIRFTSGNEDFLLLGLDEQKYFELARDLPDTAARCRKVIEGMGGLMYQAHPYRPGLRPAAPAALSGVEVYNGNPRHDSHNDLARRFAEENGLRMLSGSDAHQPQDVARGGIFVPDWVRSGEELVSFLRDTPRPLMIMDGQ